MRGKPLDKLTVIITALFMISSCSYKSETPSVLTEAPEKKIIINSRTENETAAADTSENGPDEISAATIYPSYTQEKKVSPVAQGNPDIKPLDKLVKTGDRDDLTQFYPIAENTQQIYSYTDGTETRRVVQYIRTSGNETLAQLDILKDNENSIKIISITPDEISEVFDLRKVYYRENFIGRNNNYKFIHLKTPVVKGNTWESDGMKSEIIDTEREVTIAGEKKKAVVVHSANEKGAFEFYYVRGIGLVRSDIAGPDGKMKTAMTYKGNIEDSAENYRIGFYFPDGNELTKIEVGVDFHTNDIAKDIISDNYRKLAFDTGMDPVVPQNGIIQYMYILDGMVHIDMSSEFIDYVNRNPEKEKLILRALASTVRDYYEAKQVFISVNDQRYESLNLKIEKDTPLETEHFDD